jgi:hypothetical protein
MAITTLPTPPSRSDPANFAERADDFLGALPDFGNEANDLATDVNTKQGIASTAATTATEQAEIATTQAGIATTQAGIATTQASNALVSANNAADSFESLDERYLGAKTANPTLDNEGNALISGALYFNSAVGEMRVYDGTEWVATFLPESSYVDLNSTQTLTNKTIDASSNTIIGVGDVTLDGTQTLTNKNIVKSVEVISTNTTAETSVVYVITDDLTLSLPATPTVGAQVHFSNRSDTTTLVIDRNGENIMGVAEDLILDNVNAFGTLVYADATRGWIFQ